MLTDLNSDVLFDSAYETLMEELPNLGPEEEKFRRWLMTQGYWSVRKLPTGIWVAGYDFLFDYGLMVNLRRDYPHWWTRFVYPTTEFTRCQVREFIHQWDGDGDPPGLWLKEKPGDRHHPDRPKEPWDK